MTKARLCNYLAMSSAAGRGVEGVPTLKGNSTQVPNTLLTQGSSSTQIYIQINPITKVYI